MKKYVFLIILFISIAFSYNAVATNKTAADFGAKTVLIVHYHRFDNNYNGWNLWVWPHKPQSLEGKAYSFTNKDSYGVYAIVKFNTAYTELGYIVRLNNWQEKDVLEDRFMKIGKNGVTEIWLLQGEKQPFLSVKDIDLSPRIKIAYLDNENLIHCYLTAPFDTKKFKGKVTLTANGKKVLISDVKKADPTDISNTNYIEILLKTPIKDPSKLLRLKIKGYKPTIVYCRKILDKKAFYYNGELGLIKTKTGFTFRVWSPVSTAVQLLLYKNYNASKPYMVKDMEKIENGVWQIILPKYFEGQYYKYRLHYYNTVKETVDIYSKAVSVNSLKSAIIDPNDVSFGAFETDHFKGVAKPTDAVIYEIHIKDITEGQDSGIKHKGEYLGLTEENTVDPFHKTIKTGLAHLKELGINYVHILPIQDFASVNELNKNSYNWGYDPYLYDVPEGSYSTNPTDPKSRIIEVKKMIYALHKNGIGVILDTVYNHTASVGDGSPFDLTVPYYYYRLDKKGNYLNGSGCGNEIRTEAPMMRKYIIDSLKYWVKEYHVDGFRFDLLGLFDFDTVKQISLQLHEMKPNIILYGEPWGGMGAKLGFTKGDQKGLKIALFNDGFRDALRGSVFNPKVKGFVNGGFAKDIRIKRGVVGSINYDSAMIQDFALKPEETINYVSCHDNLTLWDKDLITTPKWPESFLKRSQKLAAAIILTAQGIPFLHAGFDFCRTKNGNDNSYNAGIKVNELNYNRKYKYYDVFKYVRDLITLRRNHPIFRIDDPNYIRNNLKFLPAPHKVVAYSIKNVGLNDSYDSVIVFYNANLRNYVVSVPDGYDIVFDDNGYHKDGLTIASNQVSVSPLSALIIARSNK